MEEFMKRSAYSKLLEWKTSKNKKPLLLQGARQVGKTWLVDDFAKNEYSDFANFNFEKSSDLGKIFDGDLDPRTIIFKLSLLIGRKISPENTLVFFDEIQVCPRAITSLKYFAEEAPEYNLVAAGSLPGVSAGKKSSFPVGKVNFMTLYPLSFSEFLDASGDGLYSEMISAGRLEELGEVFHNKLAEKLKLYLYLGGMPEVLRSYLENADIAEARKIQNEILIAYKNDFSKYATADQAVKTAEVWDSIPYQLSRENKKFIYTGVSKKARGSTHALTITWLKNAGLVYPSYHVPVPKLPLTGYSDKTKFKLYLCDTGLLGAMLGLASDIILKPDALFADYNGAFIESFVASELVSTFGPGLYYWSSNGKAEVDFLIQKDNHIYPVEVKSGSSRNLKSLRVYDGMYKPEKVIRISPRIFTREREFFNIPLYGVAGLDKLI